MNVFYDFAEIILCIYAVVKHIFKRDPSKYDPDNFSIFELIYELTCVVISLVIYVMMILFLLPFVIIRMIIDIYLRRKHGEKYGGLLEEMDALWTADTQHGKHIINALFFMELKKSPEEFVSHLKKCIKKSRNLHFNSTLHNILNYKYRLWCNENVDNVIRLISLTPDERSNKSKFQEKISNLANQSLPSASPLEVLVCAETIVFNDCQDEQINANNYVVIGRFHHSVGDGVSLLSYLLELDNQESNLQQVTEKLSPKKNTEEPKVAYITYKKIVNIIKNTSLYRFDLLAPSDENILHGPTLTGQKILVFEIEHQIKYVPKIKSIRKQFKECRFTDVLHTALSASLLEHFHQHSEKIPETIHMSCITTHPRKSLNENQKLAHSFSATSLDVPLLIDENKSADGNLISRLKTIKARHKLLDQSVDSLLFYWMSRQVSVLPIWILRVIFKIAMKCTISFSNLPGVQFAKIGDEEVKNIVFFTPHVANVGVGFTIHTYGDRLQMGLIADEILLANSEQALAIVKNVYKYIDLLDNEINSNKYFFV